MTLLYFARLRETIGIESEPLDLPGDADTPRKLMAWLAGRGGGYAEAFANPDKLRCAVDLTMIALDAPLGDGCEIALFPPVTGG